jgi:hypothetical protein
MSVTLLDISKLLNERGILWNKFRGAGIIQYPSEMNPQMVSAGVTLEINYEMELHHAPLEE